MQFQESSELTARKRIERLIRELGRRGPMTISQLNPSFQRITSKELHEMVDSLVEAGKIVRGVKEGNRGRPCYTYSLPSNQCQPTSV